LTNSNRGITSSDMSDMLNNDMDVIIILASAIRDPVKQAEGLR